MRSTAALVTLTAVAVVLAGCAGARSVSVSDAEPIGSSPGETSPDTEAEVSTTTAAVPDTALDGPFPYDADKPPQPYDAFLVAAIDDIRAYWEATYPDVYGEPYLDLQGGIHPLYPGARPAPGCGGPATTYRDIENNAFYCPEGDFIAYDDALLLPTLVEQLGGEFPLAVVFAHEWGHAIQARAGLEGPTILFEQQADCFAGAWVGHLAAAGSTIVDLADDELNQAINAMIAVRDEPGSAATDAAAHGSAFDRVGAFQDGFSDGASACAAYETDPPEVLQFEFSESELTDPTRRDPDDVRFDEIVPAIEPDLDGFWAEQMTSAGTAFTPPEVVAFPAAGPYPACPDRPDTAAYRGDAFYCPSTNQVLYDADLAADLYERYGDYAVGIVLARAWSEAVQVALGSSVTGEQRSLLNDCLAGSWTRSTLPGLQRADLAVSPGDLDEGVQVLVELSDPSATTDRVGSAFERIEALRTGVLGGTPSCVSRYRP